MLVKEGTRVNYMYKEFYIDTVEDLANIDKNICCPGSVAYIISTQDVYILNSQKEWIAQ